MSRLVHVCEMKIVLHSSMRGSEAQGGKDQWDVAECLAFWFILLHWVAGWAAVSHRLAKTHRFARVAECCSVLQVSFRKPATNNKDYLRVAVCCSALQCFVVCCGSLSANQQRGSGLFRGTWSLESYGSFCGKWLAKSTSYFLLEGQQETVSRLVHVCEMTFPCKIISAFIFVTRHVHMYGHDAFMCVCLQDVGAHIKRGLVCPRTWICTCINLYMYLLNIPIYTCIVCPQQGVYGVGWLRLVGSIKLQVSFAEYHLFYRALLQKRPQNLSILLSEATP